jgi:hypothetical protein
MKKQITLYIIILGLFMNCLVPFSETEEAGSDPGFGLWFFVWATINSANGSVSAKWL